MKWCTITRTKCRWGKRHRRKNRTNFRELLCLSLVTSLASNSSSPTRCSMSSYYVSKLLRHEDECATVWRDQALRVDAVMAAHRRFRIRCSTVTCESNVEVSTYFFIWKVPTTAPTLSFQPAECHCREHSGSTDLPGLWISNPWTMMNMIGTAD